LVSEPEADAGIATLRRTAAEAPAASAAVGVKVQVSVPDAGRPGQLTVPSLLDAATTVTPDGRISSIVIDAWVGRPPLFWMPMR